MKDNLQSFLCTLFMILLNGCFSGGGDVPGSTPCPTLVEKKIPISLNCGVSS